MSVTKPKKSPFYHYDFQLNGHRFHGSTKAKNKKDAELIARQIKAKAKADLEAEKRTGNGPLTLDVAAGRFWREVGERHVANTETWRNLERLIEFFGPAKRLDEITDADVAAMVTWRSKQMVIVRRKDEKGNIVAKPVRPVSPPTVNRSVIVPLKGLFGRAKRVWRYSFPQEPNWREHMLPEAEERVRELYDDEADSLDAVIREDYEPWLTFVRLTGLRFDETLIRWSEVNWFGEQIVTTGKRGRKVTTAITPEVAAVLKPLQGQHPEWVFTYICRRTKRAATEAEIRIKGQRYPITREGAKSQWQRIRAKAKLADFRFHDFRHDVGTKLLRQTGNLKLVQKALNHSDIATTARYAHVLDDEVAAALSQVAKSRKKSRTSATKAA
jgi:integrase